MTPSRPGRSTNISRPLTREDLGVEGDIRELRGTFSHDQDRVIVYIDLIEGEIANPLQILSHLMETVRAVGGSTLRVEAFLANERLSNILAQRYGMRTEAGLDIIEMKLDVEQ